MTAEAQIKILRFLQDRELTPLGSTRPRRMDVRIVAATNRTIAAARGQRRACATTSSARLGAAPIHLPPLRDRVEDLGALAAHFLGARAAGAFEQPAFRALCLHGWPLNVRELEKIITTAAVLTGGDKPIALRDLPEPIARALAAPAAPARAGARPLADAGAARGAAAPLRGNVADVSRELGKHRAAVWRWIKKFGLGPQKFRRGETGTETETE